MFGALRTSRATLTGIGSFTVIDGALVTARDLGNNFFLEEADLGRPRAECVTRLLKELNEHVRGSYVHEDVGSLIRTNPAFLDDFSLVIATQLTEPSLRLLASACRERSLPLVVLRSYGLVGTVRVAPIEHVLVEAHSDNTPSDLRVVDPFPELLAFARDRFGHVDTLSSSERKHVPYVVLLLHAVAEYKAAHGGALPSSYKEKQAIKAALGALAERWFGEGGAADALNVEEAKAAVNTALSAPSIPPSARAVMAEAEARLSAQKPTLPPEPGQSPTFVPDPSTIRYAAARAQRARAPSAALTARAARVPSPRVPRRARNFWILAAALARFVRAEGKGTLPLLGVLPDMTADTSSYVELANIYRAKAAADAARVHAHAVAIAHDAGLPDDAVPVEQTVRLCKNAHSLQWLRFRSLDEELTPASARAAQLGALLDEGGDAPAAALYVLLRAADAFHARYNRWPGTMDDDIESDVPLLKQCVGQLLSEYRQGGATLTIRDDLVFEMCRYGAAELHTVAAIVGGVASQEVLKLVTGQYVPLNNTYIYNGLNGTGVVAEL